MSEMTVATAEEVLAVAVKHDGYEGDLPTEDETKLKEAKELVAMIQTVYDGGSRSEAALELLRTAKVDPERYPAAYEGSEEIAAEAAASQPSDPAGTGGEGTEGDPDGATATDSVESIFPGYDGQSAKQIKEAILESAASGDLSGEEFAQIIAYEEAHEERKGILSLEPEFKPKPAPAPAASATGGAEQAVGDYANPESYPQAYSNGTLGDDRINQEALPIPQKPELPEEPVLPIAIDEISHGGLAKLGAAFASLEMRGLRLVSLEEGRAAACAHLEHDAMRDESARIYETIEHDRSKSTHVENAKKEAKDKAEASEAVTIWRSRRRQHEAEARNLKALVAAWSIARDRCSREQSRREKIVSNGS